MEATKMKQNSVGLLWISCIAIISILFETSSHENTRGNPNERKKEIYQSNLPSSYSLDNLAYSIENLKSEISVLKFLTQSGGFFSMSNQSELSLMSEKCIEADCLSINFPHIRREKRQDAANASAAAAGGGNQTTAAGPTTAGGGGGSTASGAASGGSATAANLTTTVLPEAAGEGLPTWAWIVIAVAIILVLIAIIIGIIVCINMNKNPEEAPASGAASAESLSGSESEGSEEEGGRRLHRGRRQIAACSYCPRTLQRNENDGIPCGRNCCDTELYERQNFSNSS